TAGRFPGMVKRCADCGFDLDGGLVEVVPTAHYMMGGIVFEPDCTTALPGLFVAGEDAGGVHGANRLGGNGVANSTVFGGVAGAEMAHAVAHRSLADPDETAIEAGIARAEHPFALKPGDLHGLRDRLSDLMWEEVGILRTEPGLERALNGLADLRAELSETGLADTDRAFNLTWHDWQNLESLIDISEVITRAALARENSRGAHFREDFPEAGELTTSAFTSIRSSGSDLTTEQIPVTFDIVKPGESLIDGAIGAPTAAE
ncbi:MAG: FAD-binding protein, partial [Pseudomonadota bacterium]